MTFKGPFQAKPFYDSMNNQSGSICLGALRALQCSQRTKEMMCPRQRANHTLLRATI